MIVVSSSWCLSLEVKHKKNEMNCLDFRFFSSFSLQDVNLNLSLPSTH